MRKGLTDKMDAIMMLLSDRFMSDKNMKQLEPKYDVSKKRNARIYFSKIEKRQFNLISRKNILTNPPYLSSKNLDFYSHALGNTSFFMYFCSLIEENQWNKNNICSA